MRADARQTPTKAHSWINLRKTRAIGNPHFRTQGRAHGASVYGCASSLLSCGIHRPVGCWSPAVSPLVQRGPLPDHQSHSALCHLISRGGADSPAPATSARTLWRATRATRSDGRPLARSRARKARWPSRCYGASGRRTSGRQTTRRVPARSSGRRRWTARTRATRWRSGTRACDHLRSGRGSRCSRRASSLNTRLSTSRPSLLTS